MPLQAVGKKESLSEKAYHMLRQAILEGELKPGEILTEEGVAELLEISRTPVRTALQQLTLEGLLKADRKNLIVAGIEMDEIRQIDRVREELEPLSAELNCKKGLSVAQAEELRQYCEAQKEAAEIKDVKAFFQAGERFHVRLAQCSGNEFLAKMIAQASAAAMRYLINQPRPERFLDASGQEHEEILERILAGEGEAEQAKALMRQHIQGER